MSLRIVLMGTGEFALPAFRALIESDHRVCAVVTQPERTGRGHHRHVNPVRELATPFGIPVWQPHRASDPHFLQSLRSVSPDVIVVAAYGQILKPALLAIPRLGAFNLHGSLLPRHRGAAPVQYAIRKGDARTGVTIFQIEPGLDTGPVAASVETDVGPRESSGDLMQRLAELAVPLTCDVMHRLQRGAVTLTPQNHSLATHAPRISKEEGEIDWSQTADVIDCHVRAMLPWPKAGTVLRRDGHPDLRCIVHDIDPTPTGVTASVTGLNPGRIATQDRRLFVACSGGFAEILAIQPVGRRVMQVAEFLNGQPDLNGGEFAGELSPVS